MKIYMGWSASTFKNTFVHARSFAKLSTFFYLIEIIQMNDECASAHENNEACTIISIDLE